MNTAHQLRSGFAEVGAALRRPEAFVVAFRDRDRRGPPRHAIFGVLVLNAMLGLAAYGLTMGLAGGARSMLEHAVRAPLACGAAWMIALPALYIVNSALGSKLDAPTTALAALATVSFGALAMLASVPIAWFFAVALPYAPVRLAVDAIVFAGVGVCMIDVFLRVMKALEPERSRAFALTWLALVAVIGGELMFLLHVFEL